MRGDRDDGAAHLDGRSRSAQPRGPLRFTLALVFAALALLLAWPSPVTTRPRTWEDILAPLHIGATINGFELTSLRRGEEHDIVLTLRRISGERGVVEIHVLDRGRWSGIRETPSFGVAYETPRSTTTEPECQAVTLAIADAVRANDPGGLGPVDAIPLGAEPDPPAIARALDRITDVRGLAVGLCLVASTWLFASGPMGGTVAALWLFAVGLLLRAPHLDVPFVRDQDVQRLFTGHLSLREILTGQGLADRHPPLYFLVLKVAQVFGQGESAVRAPAVLAGALWGPALVGAAAALERRVDVGAMAGLAAALSVEMIARSREVSSIPLFGLLALGFAVALARCSEGRSSAWAVLLVASTALCLWTYYIASLVLLGALLPLLVLQRLSRPTLRLLGIGASLGAPALALGVATFFRDRGARVTADEHPALAWGSHGAGEMAAQCASVVSGAFGPAFFALFVMAMLWAAWRKREAALIPAGGLVATFVGIAAIAPLARVQAYYIVAVLPLLLLTIAVSDIADQRSRKGESLLGAAALGGVLAATQVPHMRAGRTLYLPDSDAFMPLFASAVTARPERKVIVVAHYDGALLAYYLAREARAPMDWSRMRVDPDGTMHLDGIEKRVQPLLFAHALGENPEQAAEESLLRAMREEPVLVVAREGFRVEGVDRLLGDCDVLARAGTGKLLRCPAEPR